MHEWQLCHLAMIVPIADALPEFKKIAGIVNANKSLYDSFNDRARFIEYNGK